MAMRLPLGSGGRLKKKEEKRWVDRAKGDSLKLGGIRSLKSTRSHPAPFLLLALVRMYRGE
jgi:hypothetical protein